MFSVRLLSSTTLIYIYLILIYNLAMNGVQGVSDAAAQFITKRTVRFHISNLLHKTGNKTQIAMIAHFHQVTEDVTLLEMDNNASERSSG